MTMKIKSKYFWVTWEKHTRTRSICDQLNIPLYELTNDFNPLIRYPTLLLQTLCLFIRKPNDHNIIIQNPSMILAIFTNFFCFLTRRRCIADCHNSGITPLEGKSKILNTLAKFSIKANSLTIVTNEALAKIVLREGGRPFILPDPLPNLPIIRNSKTEKPSIVFICTWAADEPYGEVLKAATMLENIQIIITGNYSKKLSLQVIDNMDENITLTGYLSNSDFHQVLNESWAIMDLTTRENCLLCGAYEATALEKPIILSDTKCLRSYFKKGAVYTKNNAEDIAMAIKYAISENNSLKNQILELKGELTNSWNKNKLAFVNQISR